MIIEHNDKQWFIIFFLIEWMWSINRWHQSFNQKLTQSERKGAQGREKDREKHFLQGRQIRLFHLQTQSAVQFSTDTPALL